MPSAAELRALGTYLENSGAGLMRGVRKANEYLSPWQYLPAVAQSVAPGAGVVQGNEDMRAAGDAWSRGEKLRALGLGAQGVLNTGIDFVPAMAALPALRAVGPSDEAARMARAQEQGYTIDAYKGSPSRVGGPVTNWKGKVIEDKPWEELTHFDSPNSPYAGFFSNDPAVASRFADAFGHGYEGSNPAVFPTKLKMERPYVIDVGGKPAATVQFDSPSSGWSATEYKAALANPEYDGVILKNTKDEGDVYIPKTPQQVRSKFAQFKDPASKDLLAGLAALGIGVPAAMGERE